jgi:hypothetical protein
VLRRAVPFDAIAGVWFDAETGVPVDEWFDDSLAGGAGPRADGVGALDHGAQKLDVSNRGQLVARLFLDHYAASHQYE